MVDQDAAGPGANGSGANGASPNGAARNVTIDRRQEGELLERGGRGRDAVADLLARSRRPSAAPEPVPQAPAAPEPVTSQSATPQPATSPLDVPPPPPAAQPDADARDTTDSAEDAQPWSLDRLASAIASKTARFLDGAAIDAETDFFDAGATSVDAVELVADLARDLGVRLNLDDVFADARPRRLAHRWLAALGTDALGTVIQGTVVPNPAIPSPAPPSTVIPNPVAPNTAIPSPAAPATPSALPALRPTPPIPVLPAPVLPAPALPATTPVPPNAAPVLAADEDLAWIAGDLARADLLPWVSLPESAPPRRILLTGATGFLGSHLLLDLLRRSDAHVVCLVRGSDDQDAERRLADGLASYEVPWSAEVRRRVTVLAGDIRQSHLGLTDEQWAALAQDIDSVVSVAAAVDFLRGYPSLRQTNVLGPLTLAEFALTGRIKPLHHISSIAVFNEVGITAMGEDDPVAHIDRLVAGYDKTKWAAEAALRRAREHGLVVTLLRPGGIGGHTHTGAYNPHDLSSGFMSAFTRFRSVPAFRFLNVAPVDWVSRMAAAIICEPDGWGQTYNLAGKPNTLPDLVREMQLGGMNVRVLGWDDWREDLLARLQAEPVPELNFLARVLSSPTALKLCEATLLGPAATGERAEAFAARHKLPAPTRYDAWAQVKTYQRLANDGLVRLPSPQDPPYLWFPETMVGTLGPLGGGAEVPCTLSMTLSIASMYQLVQERRIDVRGEVSCSLLHRQPLTVESGEIIVRPDEGVPRLHGIQHPLLRYRLNLRDADGKLWWLEGQKTARARRDLWQQARTLAVELGRDGEPPYLSGVVVVPGDSYVRQQIDGIRVNPDLTAQEQRVAKLLWLAWFGSQVGRGLLEPALRAGADLLDLRRDAALIRRERKGRIR